jgi:membrane protein DedA with SNARE-associated domain/rhodanese-related sulfurtransferase
METLLHIIETYGLWVVFVSVLSDQGGLPVPSYPVMIVTAALAVDSNNTVTPILFVATLATLLADVLWYACGRRFGASMLRLMCKVSLSPDSCVGATRRIYGRWGAPALIVAKYIPGFAAVATTLAGETQTSLRRFLLYDGLGAALWAGGAVALGVIFHEAVEVVLTELERLGNYALALAIAAIVVFVAIKAWQRQRFLRRIRMARISAADLAALLDRQASIVILDARTPERRARSGWIPGSVHVDRIDDLAIEPRSEVIVYCDCPNDATAAGVARQLMDKGFTHVRPLAGGLDAWRGQGGRVERSDAEGAGNASRSDANLAQV